MNIVDISILLGKSNTPHQLIVASSTNEIKYRKAAERILQKLMAVKDNLEEANVDFTEIAKGLGRFYKELKNENEAYVPTTYVLKSILPCIKRALDAKNSTIAISKTKGIDIDEVKESLNTAMEKLLELQKYLLSNKFHQDTTVQVKDVLYRMLPVRDAIHEGLHNLA